MTVYISRIDKGVKKSETRRHTTQTGYIHTRRPASRARSRRRWIFLAKRRRDDVGFVARGVDDARADGKVDGGATVEGAW